MEINYDDIKTSINLMKKVTRNMYLYDIQSSVAVKNCNKHKTLTSKMEIRVADACEFFGGYMPFCFLRELMYL